MTVVYSYNFMKRKKSSIKNQNRKTETLIELADRLGKIGFAGPTDLAYNLDHYLYGTPKKKFPKELMKKTK